MTAYEFCLGLGFLGLAIMAMSGLFSRSAGHDNDVSNASVHGHHGASAPGGASAGGHTAAIVATGAKGAMGARGGAGRGAGRGLRGGRAGVASGVWARLLGWLSPRVMFSVLVGAGAGGLVLHSVLGEPWRALAAAALGVLFEALVVGPVWRFVLGFGSAPARTLEHAMLTEARAETGFDANGHGLISVELDGQVVQVLGTLRPQDRHLRVRAGDVLVVEDVDTARNRCTVSRRDP